MYDIKVVMEVENMPLPNNEMFYWNWKLSINHVIINEKWHLINYQIIGDEKFSPGKTITLYITFDCPDLFLEDLYPGNQVIFWCAGAVFGKGTITEIVDLHNHILQIQNTTKFNDLLPRTKMDVERVERLKSIEFSKFSQYVPDLLTWIQDINWPVGMPICELLGDSGPEIIPEIQKIFRSNDEDWIYNLIVYLLPRLNIFTQKKLIDNVKAILSTSIDISYKECIENYIESYKKIILTTAST